MFFKLFIETQFPVIFENIFVGCEIVPGIKLCLVKLSRSKVEELGYIFKALYISE